MNKEFDRHFDKRRKNNPEEPVYITLCYVLEYSGEEAPEVYEIFDEYMPPDDFFLNEREQMVRYLIDISKDIQ